MSHGQLFSTNPYFLQNHIVYNSINFDIAYLNEAEWRMYVSVN